MATSARVSRQRVAYQVEIHRQGVALQGAIMPGNPSGKGGGERGEITTLSAASRRRLREALLTHYPPEGWMLGGFTITIPGPVMTPVESRKLWNGYCLKCHKEGWGMIWRMEVQARGAMHWHGNAIAPCVSRFDSIPPAAWLQLRMRDLWLGCLAALPEVEHVTKNGRWIMATRDCLPGAFERACCVEWRESIQAEPAIADSRWLRYLNDHATKTQQTPTGEGYGRHWGIVGRGRWVVAPAVEVLSLSASAYVRLCRWKSRMETPSKPAPGKPFGRKLCRVFLRGRAGRWCSFTHPETVRRMVALAVTLDAGKGVE